MISRPASYNRLTERIMTELRQVVGQSTVAVDEPSRFAASLDNARISVLPAAVIRPENEAAVGGVLRLANRHRIPVTVRGAGSSTTGSATPVQGGLVIDFAKWKRCRVDAEAGLIEVQPGVTIEAMQTAAAKRGWFYPPDPSSHRYCTIGGAIALNAGGLHAAKYGVTRDYVVALEGFLPTGEFVRWGGKVRKFAAGYNLRDLWIGSEGTLGVITGAVLRLVLPPETKWTALAAYANERAALLAVRRLHKARLLPGVLEFLDRQTVDCFRRRQGGHPLARYATPPALLLIELDGTVEGVARDAVKAREVLAIGALNVEEAPSAEEAELLWAARRGCSKAMFALGDSKLNEDVVVPLRQQIELLKFTAELRHITGLATPTFGHAADGNFHVHLMYHRNDPKEKIAARQGVELLMKKVVALGGAISGEHGIGLAKSPFLAIQHSEAEISAMRAIKTALDPNGILNPGKIFEPYNVWDAVPAQVKLPWD